MKRAYAYKRSAPADAEWRALYAWHKARGDRWQAEALDRAVCCGGILVRNLTREARERLRERRAVVLYDPEWQLLRLFGEQDSVYALMLGQSPSEAEAALGQLIGAYISRVVEYIGLGIAPWGWNGRAPWEQR